MSEKTTATAYCPHCDAERRVRITVPWQDDICTHCGMDVGARPE